MRIRELLGALARQWDEIRAQLTDKQADRLVALVAAFVAEVIPARLVRRANRIIDLLIDILPDGHSLLLILERPTNRLVNVSTDHAELAAWGPVVESLRNRLPGAGPVPTLDEVIAGTQAWLLAAESIGADEVRAHGHDPDDPGLIRLERPDGGAQWPAFQFEYDQVAPDLVRSINRILHAAEDPWGAADWWLGENTWLAGIPARLLGTVDDRELTRAALDERAEG